MPASDDILKHQLREGNIQAFKRIFDNYYAQLVNYGSSLTQDKEVSRELVQDVFTKIWEKRETNQIIGSLKAYLFTAVNNQALNWIRHEKIKRAYESENLNVLLHGIDLPAPVNPFLKEALQNAINNLPERAREIFLLSQIDGNSHKEIAAKLDISIKTVENQLNRARKNLQKKLHKYR